MIGTGRAADRDRALGLGVNEFVELETDPVEAAGEADVVLDVIGGDMSGVRPRSYVLEARWSRLPNRPRSSLERAGDLLRR